MAVGDVANLIQRVHETLARLGGAQAEPEFERKQRVVSIRASVKADYIVCMECGKRQKTLKRRLETVHRMTPDQYRKDYGLPVTYPMVSSDYSERRREMAKTIGLGTRGRGSTAE